MSSKPLLFSLGANLGDRERSLDTAASLLGDGVISDLRVSSVYETDPVGYLDQPMFLNMCVSGSCSLAAPALRNAIRDIERACGRSPRPRWHEREIDIDVLLYGDAVRDDDGLRIPHPRMHERRFVLVPACEIAASMIHPGLGVNLATLLERCTDVSDVRPWRAYGNDGQPPMGIPLRSH
ncbi:MAG: 2-amino-4-hydroxy-6-hydroxymethyldihydropteridine diphosphokinase [Candidatus Kapaibacterium sp.]